jgi:hypothetical protein
LRVNTRSTRSGEVKKCLVLLGLCSTRLYSLPTSAYAVRLEHARVLRITEVDANFDRLLPGQVGLRGRDGQDKGGNAVNSIGRQPSGYAARLKTLPV